MLLDMTPPAMLLTRTSNLRHVLILDNNDGNRMLLKFAMMFGRMTFVEAENVSVYQSAWKADEFAFAFLDIELPDVDGIEIAREIRATDQNIAIIICSTKDDPITVGKAVEAGADMFLVKPFQLDTLITLVKVMTRDNLRTANQVLVIDNTGRIRWEHRPQTVFAH